MVDFNKMLAQELNKFKQEDENEGGSTNNTPVLRRQHEVVNVNKHTPFVGRILPLTDRWFAKKIDRIWVEYTKRDGTSKVIPIIIDEDDPKDELAKIAVSIMKYNAQMRKEKNDDATIKLNSRERGNFHIDHKYEVLGIPLKKTADGMALATTKDGGYQIINYVIPQTGYRHILDIISDKSYGIQGTPFDTELGCITKGKTFPIKIMFDGGMSYSVTARPDIILPEIVYDYEAKDEKGNFLYFDDPDIYSDTTLHTSPDFYEFILKQVKKQVDPVLNAGNESSITVTQNPYANQQQSQQVQSQVTQQESRPQAVQPHVVKPVAPQTQVVVPVAPQVQQQTSQPNPVSPHEPTDDEVLDSSEDVQGFLDKIDQDLPF